MTAYQSTEPTWDHDSAGPREDVSSETDSSVDVEALAQDIEQTRDEMTGTVEAIGDRLDPSNIVQEARQTVRDATVGKVEEMANNVAETASDFIGDARYTAQDAGNGLLETVKRNPIPAAMAGIGIGWLLMNRGGGRSDRRSTHEGARWTGRDEWDRYESAPQRGLADRAGGAVEQVGQEAGQLAETVGSKVGGAADQARSTMGQVPDQVGGVAREVGWNAQRIVEDNPLAVGAIAVAVGAALGMALPETQTEQRVLGPAAEKAISTAEEVAGEATQQLETANR